MYEIKHLIADLETIAKAVNRVVGAARYLQSQYDADYCGVRVGKPSESTVTNSIKIDEKENEQEEFKIVPITKKQEDNTTFNLKDTTLRMKGNSYEIRFRKAGIEKSFSSKSLAVVQAKAKNFLREINKQLRLGQYAPKYEFKKFADYYNANYRKPALCEKAYENLLRVVKLHVTPYFGDCDLSKIKAQELQEFFVKFLQAGKGRTAETLKCYLNGLFDTALRLGKIKQNPMLSVKIPKHYRKHGVALTLTEETELLKKIEGSYFETSIKALLYSGMRVSELHLLKSADIDFENNTLAVTTTKQKDRANVVKRILPIFPKLLPVLKAANEKSPLTVDSKRVSFVFKKLMPEHHLHELRHTFTTRCRECGIDNELTSLWTGHTFPGNTTAIVYTHFSIDYQQKQALKLDY